MAPTERQKLLGSQACFKQEANEQRSLAAWAKALFQPCPLMSRQPRIARTAADRPSQFVHGTSALSAPHFLNDGNFRRWWVHPRQVPQCRRSIRPFDRTAYANLEAMVMRKKEYKCLGGAFTTPQFP